jgi:hypothetical protein
MRRLATQIILTFVALMMGAAAACVTWPSLMAGKEASTWSSASPNPSLARDRNRHQRRKKTRQKKQFPVFFASIGAPLGKVYGKKIFAHSD